VVVLVSSVILSSVSFRGSVVRDGRVRYKNGVAGLLIPPGHAISLVLVTSRSP